MADKKEFKIIICASDGQAKSEIRRRPFLDIGDDILLVGCSEAYCQRVLVVVSGVSGNAAGTLFKNGWGPGDPYWFMGSIVFPSVKIYTDVFKDLQSIFSDHGIS